MIKKEGRATCTPAWENKGWERVTRIELALSAWEADVLPLNYTRALALSGLAPCPVATLRCCVRPDIVPETVGCLSAAL